MKTFTHHDLRSTRLIAALLVLAYGAFASLAVAQEPVPPGAGATPAPPAPNAASGPTPKSPDAPQGAGNAASKTVLKITGAWFGDRSRNETCDAFPYFHRLCHVVLEEKEKEVVMKDDAVDPSYCAAKRAETDKNKRYEGVDLCGFKPSPIGQNKLYIEYKCATGKDTASAKANLNSSPLKNVEFLGWVEWARIRCDGL